MGGIIDTIAAPTAASVVNAVVQGGPRRQYKWNKKAAEDTNRMNRENAEWTLEQNRKLQEEQRLYDSPAEQMARLRAAGLNPNLIYGNGTSAAGAAFPIQQSYIGSSRIDAPDASYPDVVGSFISASQAQAQTELSRARTEESAAKRAILAVQEEIAKTNPMLRPSVAASVSDSMEQVAALKASEAYYLNQIAPGETRTRGMQKIDADIQAMFQRLGLNTADLAIKNRILESKEFENVVKEMQARWLKDSEITPEHIRQGLMMVLSKMLGR